MNIDQCLTIMKLLAESANDKSVDEPGHADKPILIREQQCKPPKTEGELTRARPN
jgi:hypothetical protein